MSSLPIFLNAQDPEGLQAWLHAQGWVPPEAEILTVARAGEGNMNCTLRVETNAGSFVLKQARPWVEKYPSIPAPDSRAVVEAAFYAEAAKHPRIAAGMPRLLGACEEARMLMLEDLTPATDFTDIYASGQLGGDEWGKLNAWLDALHTECRDADLAVLFANTEMRALNHAHIFALPMRSDTGWDLDAWTPGLAGEARQLWEDAGYARRVKELGELYLGGGTCLVHGDYFPGSWMRTANGVRIIDPEFCFWGIPEFDRGVMHAHLLLARVQPPAVESTLAKAFAGVEIMRRLIGVAQLPLRRTLEEKSELLALSRQLVNAL